MYSIHTTPGLIVESRPSGEAGKILWIFTRDFGLVRATAQGIRLEKSKLRYHVTDHTFGTFSLVRGKEYWRLTSAQSIGDELDVIRGIHSGKEIIVRITLLLRRLLQGEEPHPELFEHILSFGRFIVGQRNLNPEQLKTLESLTVLRVLFMLGYIGNDSKLNELVRSPKISLETLDFLAGERTSINQHINQALRESHL